MRLFAAVDVDDKIRAAAGALIAELARANADVKWVEPENMHLTLRFLGETSEDSLPKITSAMERTAADNGCHDVVFDRLGAFGAASHPKVIWLGIATGAKDLAKLAYDLQSNLERSGIKPQDEPGREFSAHLTLGRVRGPRNIKKLAAAMKSAAVPGGLACRVEKILLYRSRLCSTGPKYEVLSAAALRQ